MTVGIRQQITDVAHPHGTAEWTNWSRLGFPRVFNALPAAWLPRALCRLTMTMAGSSRSGRVPVHPAWTLRAGVGYEISPIESNTRYPRLADYDRIWLSLGATYNWSDQLSFDLAYSYIFAANETKLRVVPGNPSYNPLVGPLVADVDFGRAHPVGRAQVPLGQPAGRRAGGGGDEVLTVVGIGLNGWAALGLRLL